MHCFPSRKWATFTELPDYYNQRHQETLSFILLYDFYVIFYCRPFIQSFFSSLHFLATLPLLTGTWWGPRTWLKTKLKMENFLFQGLGPFPEVEFFFCCSRWHRFLDFSEVMACNWTLGCHRGEIYHRGHKDESSESYKLSTLKLCIKTVLLVQKNLKLCVLLKEHLAEFSLPSPSNYTSNHTSQNVSPSNREINWNVSCF